MKAKLCCIFNYAPLYRKSIYLKIDEEFDAQFCFGDMESDIKKMDYNDFKKPPKLLRERKIFGKILWRKDILYLPFKEYDHFLIIGDSSLSYFPFILLCKILGKKVYAWGHGVKSFCGRMKWFTKWFYNNCDVFFTYGEKGKERLIELGVPAEKLKVIYNSLCDCILADNNSKYESSILKSHFGNDLPTLLFVGRLTKVKQLDWILGAMEYHTNNNIMYNVLFIGEGEDSDRLREIVYKKGLSDRVWFYGKCYNDNELSALIYNADLCVSPGNVGLTAIHALMYGTPVLSHDDFETQMPEYEIIVPEKTGLLYKMGDFMDFCKKIEEWNSLDINRKDIRNNCYKLINDKFNANYQIRLLKDTIK